MRLYSIRNKKRRVWGVDFTNEKGRRIRKIIGTKAEAELRLAEIRMNLFRGKFEDLPGIAKDIEIEPFMRRYLEWREAKSPGFIKKDRGRFNTLSQYFQENGIGTLKQISPDLIERLQTIYLENHKPKSWNNLLETLKAVLNRAVEWGAIDFNPIARIKPLRLDKTFHYFTAEECRLIIKQAEEPLKRAVMILLYTGLRRSELFNLRWRDVNLNNNKITVKPYSGYSTKSKRPRSIPISHNLRGALSGNRGRGDDYVCRPYPGLNTLYKKFSELLKSLGLMGNLHDLRHTFASHLAMAGVPIPAIKELLGHSDISTTMIYAHMAPESLKGTTDKLPY